jgi:hypothetical protein
MWCDNCLLVFPLRGGAIAWGVWVAAYSLAGGIFLLVDGQFLFFTFPEWQIFGGIGIGVASLAIVTIFAISNRSYVWTRTAKFLWPFVAGICAIRAIIMIVELQRGKDKIQWECDNGGQLWHESAALDPSKSNPFPSSFCAAGFASLNAAFIVGLLIDLVSQLYMLFLNWRFSKRLEHYSGLKGPYHGGYYGE